VLLTERMPDEHPATEPTPDELHERFRAALDRKAGKGRAGTAGPGSGEGGKASASTASSKHRREFRRKSGG
jgi:hypothetical protein